MTNTKKRKSVLVETEYYEYLSAEGVQPESSYVISVDGKALIDMTEDMTPGIIALLESQGYEVRNEYHEGVRGI